VEARGFFDMGSLPNFQLSNQLKTVPFINNHDTFRMTLAVPEMSCYAVFGPSGISGGFSPALKRTTQEFQLDDDLGDSQISALGYGGKITSENFRKAESIWVARNTTVRVSVFTDGGGTSNSAFISPMKTVQRARVRGTEAAIPAQQP
jgi:alpha-amylase